jgi:hypothetical protein
MPSCGTCLSRSPRARSRCSAPTAGRTATTTAASFPIEPPELGRDQTVSEGAFYRVATAAGTGSARYGDRTYEVIEAGTTASSQPAYDTTIGIETTDGTAVLKAYESFTRVTWVEAVTDRRTFTLSEELSGR